MYPSRFALFLVLVALCCLGTRQNERRKKTETFYFSAEDFDRKDWKYRNMFDSGPIESNGSKPFLLYRDSGNPKATSKSKSSKTQQCKALKLPTNCILLCNCHEVNCELNLLGNNGSMKITFPPISASLTATVQITVQKRKMHSTYHLKAGKSSPGVVIKEFGYKVGNMQTQVEFSFSMKTLSGRRLSVKIFSTTRGQVSGFTKYKFKTKFISIRSTSKLSKKMGIKEKQGKHGKSSYGGGPCANIKLPSVCGITPDCMKFSCALKFIGQQISLSFGINKCATPLTLFVSASIPALKIKWSHKIKSGKLIPIPGYGVSVGGIGGGVLIEVLLKPVRSRLALQVKLIVGAKVGFMRVFPINFRLLRLRLPIKIKGCGKSKSDYSNTTSPTKNPSKISTPTVDPTSSKDLATEYPTTSYPTTSYPTTSYPTGNRDEYENPTNNEDHNPNTYNMEQENGYEAAWDQTEDSELNNGINDDEEEIPVQYNGMGIAPSMSAYEQLQPLQGDVY